MLLYSKREKQYTYYLCSKKLKLNTAILCEIKISCQVCSLLKNLCDFVALHAKNLSLSLFSVKKSLRLCGFANKKSLAKFVLC